MARAIVRRVGMLSPRRDRASLELCRRKSQARRVSHNPAASAKAARSLTAMTRLSKSTIAACIKRKQSCALRNQL
jgi:hypothetical protein